MLNKTTYRFQSFSLKTRISVLLIFSSSIPFLIVMVFSYNTMTSILSNKLQKNYSDATHQTRNVLEDAIQDMNDLTQQIVFSENIRFKMGSLLETEIYYERLEIYNELKKEFNLMTFSSNIGLSFIYLNDSKQYLFNNSGLKENFSISRNRVLVNGYKIKNFGPHISNEKYNNDYVLSTVRGIDVSKSEDVHLYIETNLDLLGDFGGAKSNNQIDYLIVDKNNRVIFSENHQSFPEDKLLRINTTKMNSGQFEGFYWFKSSSKYGWSVISIISSDVYKKEIYDWIEKMLYLLIAILIISSFLAILLWNVIYKPINQFNKEISFIRNNDFHSEIIQTNIPEFVDLKFEFRKMKKQITELIIEIEKKERNRSNLEIEKLMHQINPHFLMNTLDTAKWLSLKGSKKEVSQLLSALNKILYYNLGKVGEMSTVTQEIDSMEQYIKIQQVRYDFIYSIDNLLPKELYEVTVPRFILQPLVENSINHGIDGNGIIHVSIEWDGDKINLIVKDNGKGIDKKNIEKLLNESNSNISRQGMGIGLNYVKRVLQHAYGDQSNIRIESIKDVGTTIILEIPISSYLLPE